MPKSSTATPMPTERSWPRISMDCSRFRMTMVSVISTSTRRESTPASRTIESRDGTSFLDMNWRGERFTDTITSRTPSASHACSCRRRCETPIRPAAR